MTPAGWMTETIKNEINEKYILSHEYKSIVGDTDKQQKETEYKQQKMIVRKRITKSKMQHYHEELLENAKKNPKDTWNLLRQQSSTWKIEAKQMQFPEPHQKCQNIQQLFYNSRGETVQRRETEAADQWI